jgi:signal transduction histidine kinase
MASVVVAVAVGGAVVAAYRHLERQEVERFADLVEAEVRVTRSELVRGLESQLQALRRLADFWATRGDRDPRRWRREAGVDPQRLVGVELIVWRDVARGTRYAAKPGDLALDRRPTDEEWRRLAPLFSGAYQARGEAMLGPELDDAGHWSYRLQVPASDRAAGVLVAVVNGQEALESLLDARSRDYALAVSWSGRQLYRRGTAAADLPPTWIGEAPMELSPGPAWRVVQAPTAERAASATSPALPALLFAGLAAAVLAGFLVYQTLRARERAPLTEGTASQRLAAQNRALQRHVDERTRELAQRTADLHTISGPVAHDLRNPLNTLGLNVHLLHAALAQGDKDLGATAIDHIDRARQQMADILDRLRSFSRASFGECRCETVDVAALAREVFKDLIGAEPPPSVECHVQDLPACQADAALLRMLLASLVGNALKFTRGRSERRVEVGFEPGSAPTTYYVKDNGSGFDPAEADELFEPFRRREAGDSPSVGLAVAARIVHRHGGRIWASGPPEAGATFYFYLANGSDDAAGEAASRL